jgi:hypothetical protein
MRLLTATISAGILVEAWVHIAVIRAPRTGWKYTELLPDVPVLEQPLGNVLVDCVALYHSVFHRHALINGYSGYQPPHYAPLKVGLERGESDVIAEITGGAPAYVIESDSIKLVKGVPAPTRPLGPALPISAVLVSGEPGPVFEVIDADLRTAWRSAAPQRGREQVTAELRETAAVGAVVLSLGGHIADFPRELAIDLSTEGSAWKPDVWRGPTAALTVSAALRNPREVPVQFAFPPQRARFVRLRQLGDAPTAHWAIAELSIHP